MTLVLKRSQNLKADEKDSFFFGGESLSDCPQKFQIQGSIFSRKNYFLNNQNFFLIPKVLNLQEVLN